MGPSLVLSLVRTTGLAVHADLCPQAMRTLSWKHTLGLVTMDVELADRTLSVAVTPVQAVVLLYFQDQGEPTGSDGLPWPCSRHDQPWGEALRPAGQDWGQPWAIGQQPLTFAKSH